MIVHHSLFEKLAASPAWRKFKKILLVISIAFTVIGLALKFLTHTPGGTIMLIFGMGMLSFVLFFSAFEQYQSRFVKVNEDGNGNREIVSTLNTDDLSKFHQLATSFGFGSFLHKLLCWGSAVAVIGALFTLCHWPGHEKMLIIGIPTLAIALILKLLVHLATRDI